MYENGQEVLVFLEGEWRPGIYRRPSAAADPGKHYVEYDGEEIHFADEDVQPMPL